MFNLKNKLAAKAYKGKWSTKKIIDKFDQRMFKRYTWFIKSHNIQNTFGLELDFDVDINLIYEANHGFDIYELYGLNSKVILRQFGSFSDDFLTIESVNKLERRTDLMGLTLRLFE